MPITVVEPWLCPVTSTVGNNSVAACRKHMRGDARLFCRHLGQRVSAPRLGDRRQCYLGHMAELVLDTVKVGRTRTLAGQIGLERPFGSGLGRKGVQLVSSPGDRHPLALKMDWISI